VLDSGYRVATAGTKNTGRSGNAQFFHGSEVAFWPNDVEHMAGLGQTVADAPGTEIILESTGNGEGNMFHSMWGDAERGKGDYIAVFVPWYWQEEYRKAPPPDFVLDDEEAEYAQYNVPLDCMVWRRQKLIELRGDTALFDQEYPAAPHLAFRRRALESFITSDLVWRARKKRGVEGRGAKIMGVDVAEYGDDDTCVCYRQGRNGCANPEATEHGGYDRWHGLGPMEVAGRVARRADVWKPDWINVDCTGVGSGVADRLIELGYRVNRIHFGERAIENNEYVLRKDEMYGEAKTWLQDIPNCLPDDDAFQTDATGPSYGYDSSRRLKIESKEHMKKRNLKSPDGWEAFVLTHAVLVSVGTGEQRQALKNRKRPSWRG